VRGGVRIGAIWVIGYIAVVGGDTAEGGGGRGSRVAGSDVACRI